MLKYFRIFAFLITALAVARTGLAQDPQASNFGPATTVCGTGVPPPLGEPPANSGPVVYQIVPCIEADGRPTDITLVEQATYLYYISMAKPERHSRPSEGVWIPWTDEIEQVVLEDFKRLWATNFLDDLKIEVEDYKFTNGVTGKIVIYHLEERQRIKIVDYVGSKKVDAAAVEEALKKANIQLRLDSFVDDGTIRKTETVIRELFKEKGYPYAEITHDLRGVPGGPKLVNLTFRMSDGPQVKIKKIEFVGNTQINDAELRKQMKENRQYGTFSFISGRGTYKADKFDLDAERVIEHYRNNGFVRADVGEPELRQLNDSKDGKKRWVELRIPVVEGRRYRVGDLTFEGNTVIKSDGLKTMFKMEPGEYYSNKKIRDGFIKAKDIYGAGGYWELGGYPDFKFRGEDNGADPVVPASLAAEPLKEKEGIVDVKLVIQEGKQYFVNKISFAGNTTTHDNVIRREMRLYEGSVFNTEALKYSVRRVNQLGYFHALDEHNDVVLERTPGTDNRVDVKLKLTEENRNQINFGAGVSQFEGFFGQLSFQTANFLGRGESLTVSLQGGSRARNYTVGFTEPFLFDRNITGGVNLFNNEIRYVNQYTQQTSGVSTTLGYPLGRGFTRMFMNYSYERVRVTQINVAYQDISVLQRNPFLRDSLLIGADGSYGGDRIISKVTPTITQNTVDHPIFPTQGKRLTAQMDIAGLGGNTAFYKPMLEGVYYWKENKRMSFGMRGQFEYVKQRESRLEVPIFERLFLGGEYSIRGFDVRMIGPSDPVTGLVLGGNKTLLFNFEQIFSLVGPVRLILFYDAGQVRNFGERFGWTENLVTYDPLPVPPLVDPLSQAALGLTDPNVKQGTHTTEVSAFKTSTGAELRFFMPVLNVPFRLIFAFNPQRAGVLDNNLKPQDFFQFRFAVGTTF